MNTSHWAFALTIGLIVGIGVIGAGVATLVANASGIPIGLNIGLTFLIMLGVSSAAILAPTYLRYQVYSGCDQADFTTTRAAGLFVFLTNLAFVVATLVITSTTHGGAFAFNPLEIALLAVSGTSMLCALVQLTWNEQVKRLQAPAKSTSETSDADQDTLLSPRRTPVAASIAYRHERPPVTAADPASNPHNPNAMTPRL